MAKRSRRAHHLRRQDLGEAPSVAEPCQLVGDGRLKGAMMGARALDGRELRALDGPPRLGDAEPDARFRAAIPA